MHAGLLTPIRYGDTSPRGLYGIIKTFGLYYVMITIYMASSFVKLLSRGTDIAPMPRDFSLLCLESKHA